MNNRMILYLIIINGLGLLNTFIKNNIIPIVFIISGLVVIGLESILFLKNHTFTKNEKRAIYTGLLFGIFDYVCFLGDLTFSIIGWFLFGIQSEGNIEIKTKLAQGIFFTKVLPVLLLSKLLIILIMFIAGFSAVYKTKHRLLENIIFWLSWLLGSWITLNHFFQAGFWILSDALLINNQIQVIEALGILAILGIGYIAILNFFITLSDVLSWNRIMS